MCIRDRISTALAVAAGLTVAVVLLAFGVRRPVEEQKEPSAHPVDEPVGSASGS